MWLACRIVAFSLLYSLFIQPANSFASASVLSYAVSSSIIPTSSITHTTHFLLLMSIPIFLILFIPSLQIVFGRSEDAITCQCERHGNAASWIALFKSKCAKHMFPKRSIHHRYYDENVFTCIQAMNVFSVFENCKDFLTSLYVWFKS